jgi:hypothetical protein
MKTQYREYLADKGKKQLFIEESMGFVDIFFTVLADISEVSDSISIFIERINPRGLVAVRAAYQFLDDYTKFIEKEQPSLADAVREGCLRIFEQTAINDVKERKQKILPIPASATISPKCRGELTNEEYIAAFGELQKFVIACYDEIEKAPFNWGYPIYYATNGYYNRVNDILFALTFCGVYQNGVLTVDGNKFFAYSGVKRHKKVELMVSGFEKMGLKFDKFAKKIDSFRVTYPKNPLVLHSLCSYMSDMDENKQHWSYGTPRHSFSYRFIECPTVQTHETAFLAEFDYMSKTLQEIQLWLHAEAAKCGFAIVPDEHIDKGCIIYKKGSKHFLLVGEKEINKKNIIWSKVSFLTAFETAPDKMKKFCDRFPLVFNLENPGKCCNEKPGHKCMFTMKFNFNGVSYKRCGLNNFIFNDITLNDVEAILEIFLIENKVK